MIAGDDDKLQESQNGRNPGREKATLAAKAVDGATVFPIFAPGEQQEKRLSDFNDLAQKSTLGKVGLIPFRVKNMNNIAMRFEEDCHGETSQRCRAH
ncbi:hypothetical protein AXE65_12065 [Ventosimonas gracilis]|uniref:Uncharacterized protein n=1 Tax=Ventosimonas gracilis TaxID=1680762 RepID=A0A139SVY3_9GAMM|nr:hypothetical protein AXE65_12065 [Ventosimonas gracilis]